MKTIKLITMKKLIFILLIVLNIYNVKASDEGTQGNEVNSNVTVAGRVIDKISGEPLVGVEVYLLDTDIRVYTDLDGNFEFKNIAPGAHALKTDYISYQGIVENFSAESNSKTLVIKLKSVEK